MVPPQLNGEKTISQALRMVSTHNYNGLSPRNHVDKSFGKASRFHLQVLPWSELNFLSMWHFLNDGGGGAQTTLPAWKMKHSSGVAKENSPRTLQKPPRFISPAGSSQPVCSPGSPSSAAHARPRRCGPSGAGPSLLGRNCQLSDQEEKSPGNRLRLERGVLNTKAWK